MRNILKPLPCFLLIITFLFSPNVQILGQDKVSLSAGFGLPELINVGMQYRFKQTQIGIGFGYLPPYGSPSEIIYWEQVIFLSGDFYYHFGELPKLSKLRPWYTRLHFGYSREGSKINFNDLFLSLRIGREFNISKRVGIGIDLGIIWAHKLNDPSHQFIYVSDWPGLSIRVFCKI